MRKEFPHMKDCDILKHMHERFPNTKLHINLACWKIPFEHREDGHCGEHTQNIRSCIESLRIRSILKTCRQVADKYWAKGHTTIRVTCICDGGMHASVAVAAILQHVYHQRGYNSRGPYHIDPVARNCWKCGECQPNAQKDIAMSAVAADFILGELQCELTSS